MAVCNHHTDMCYVCVYECVYMCVCVYIHVCVYEEGQFQSIDGYNRYTGAYFGSQRGTGKEVKESNKPQIAQKLPTPRMARDM